MEFTLLFAALTGVGSAYLGTRLWPERLPERPADKLIRSAAIGAFSGRIIAMLLQGINPLTNPGDILILRGGVSIPAATAAAIVSYGWSTGWRPSYLDAIAPSALLGLAGWHAGCLWRQACLGTPSDLPWAWAQSGSTITRHPVELYAAVALLLAAIVVARLDWTPLLKTGVALASAGLVRLVTEPMRPSIGSGPVGWYVAAVVIGVLVATMGSRILARTTANAT